MSNSSYPKNTNSLIKKVPGNALLSVKEKILLTSTAHIKKLVYMLNIFLYLNKISLITKTYFFIL